MNVPRTCAHCNSSMLQLTRKDIGPRGVKLTYTCQKCGTKASKGTWANVAISLLFGLVLLPVLAFVVQGYTLETAPRGVFGVIALMLGLAAWEATGIVRFDKANPEAGTSPAIPA